MKLQKEIAVLKELQEEFKNEHQKKIKFHKNELNLIISQYYVLMSENETFTHDEAKAIKEKTSLRVDDIIDYMDSLYQSNNKLVELIEILYNQNQERF